MNAQWTFNQNITAPPVSGGLRFNATTIAATTTVWISETDRDGLNRAAGLDQLMPSDQLMVQSAQGRAVFNIITATDSGTYRTLAVSVQEFTGTRPSASAITTVYSVILGGSMPQRGTVAKTTASLAAGASESGTIDLGKSYRLMTISTSAPARVRLYTTTAKRDADAARALGTDPTGDHGLMLEFVSTAGLLAADLSPTVDGFTVGGSTAAPYTITNTGTGAAAIAASFGWIRTE
jgi:hypothetical protein